MNNADQFNQFSEEERAALGSLAALANGIQPDERFVKRTEALLKERFASNQEKPARGLGMFWQYFAGTALAAALVFGMIWLVRSVAPEPLQPAAGGTPFACAVTRGNGSLPPGETLQSLTYLGNGKLWTDLWPDGKIMMTASDRESDGAYGMKWAFWRGDSGEFSISGRRLDAQAEPLRARINSGYGDNGLIVVGLVFPTTGCWEVTGKLGDATLTFVTEVVLADGAPTAAPATEPAATPTSAATPAAAAYQVHGTNIRLAVGFPQVPASAGLYRHAPESPATVEIAQALTQRFGISGQAYRAAVDSEAINDLLVTDGNQRLYVISAQRYTYSASNEPAPGGVPVSQAEAAPVIDTFLKAHGFDFEYQLTVANGMGAGWFYVIPLNVEGRPTHYDFNIPQGFSVQVSPQGKVLVLDANLLDIDPQPLGQFGLIGAEQAWQRYVDPLTSLGVRESFRSVSTVSTPLSWSRIYPVGVPLALYGHAGSFAAAEAGQPPFITLDSYTLSGKTTGLQNVDKSTLVEALGQFVEQNGIRTFQVDSWQVLSQFGPSFLADSLQGSLRKEGGQVIFSSNGNEYVLENTPADLPLPLADVNVYGYLMEPKFEWQNIISFDGQSRGGGGGGGGGGTGFAKLNLSGTPVPWPTPQSAAPSQPSGPALGLRLDGQQGLFMFSIYEKADGSRRSEYGFSAEDTFYQLQADAQFLASMEPYQNRPVNIWGAVTGYNQNQTPIVSVERFEIPYPDVNFQILSGTQKLTTLAGQSVAVFTALDGSKYAQLSPTGRPTDNLIGVEGDAVEFEALVIPGEMFGGLPGMRIFGGGMAVSPKSGQTAEMVITANQPQVLTESGPASASQPELTIESIELVYFTSDPRYAAAYPLAMSPYLQPVWRFYGHYSTGDEAEILIQALPQEYLLPEAAPAVEGG